MRNNLDAIKRTLDLYDPDRQTVVVGTAALALQGLKVPDGVPDVDTLAPKHHIQELRAEAEKNTLFHTPDATSEDRISLRPSRLLTVLPYQSFSEVIDERYDIDFFLAYSRSIMVGDYRVVPVPEILKWKATVGREKDLDKVQKILSRRSIRNYLSPQVKNEIQEKAAASRRILEATRLSHVCSYGCHDVSMMQRIDNGYGRTSGYSRSFRVGAQY